ncbi:MAG: nitrous oxide-stimulated promoter family protein [Prevotella sp.]|nr:nitrous oxide-stimulated promoter family protein [Prevotella sp.]MDY4217230.1 nitrous oxide-stimulated promoter family protein [Prevotella sp.]
MSRIEKEKIIVKEMIALYAKHKEGKKIIDGHYKELADYCEKRLDKCYWGEKKPACKACTIHCYGKAKREEIKKVMRWAGPRMLLYRPWFTIKHFFGK